METRDIDGESCVSTKDIAALHGQSHFKSVIRLNGWKHTLRGWWAVNERGTSGLSVGEWLEAQTSYHAHTVIAAVGVSHPRMGKIAKAHKVVLAPFVKGRYDGKAVRELLEKIGRLADCPHCGGMAVSQKQGGMVCLDCNESSNDGVSTYKEIL